MIKDLEIIKEFDKQIKILDADIERLTEKRNQLYNKKSRIEDSVRKFSVYNTEEIAEIIKDLMQENEGINYTVITDDVSDKIMIKPKEKLETGPIFRLPNTKTCMLMPSDSINNDEKNLYVYEFINFIYKERSKANMEELDYSELSAILSEYFDLIKSKNGGKKLIK